MTTTELIAEAATLPVEQRAAVADGILRSLNTPEPAVDKEWAKVAQRRLRELRDGRAEAIPTADVFAEVQARFGG